MPNHIKHGTSQYSLKKGAQSFGVSGETDYGPTSSSQFYQGITPPNGGYTIYVDRVTGGPSIHVANNDNQCIFFLKSFGATGSTINEVLSWATAQTTLYVAVSDFITSDLPYAKNGLVTNGLLIALDVSDNNSYVSGTTVNDLHGFSNLILNGSLSVVSGSVYGSPLNIPFINMVGVNSSNYGSFSSNTTFNNIRNLTCEFLVFFGSLGTGGPDTLFSNEGARFYVRADGNGALGGFVRGSGYPTLGQFESNITGNGTVVINTWYHLVFTVDFDGNFSAYKNGILSGSQSISNLGGNWVNTTAATTSSYQPALGSRYSGYGTANTKMTGGINMFRFYNRSLNSTEITQNFNILKSRINL